MLIRLFILILMFVSQAMAGLITIPLEDKEFKLAPASDLVYQGHRIDEVEAMELQKSGVDLSTLDPYLSDLYNPNSLPANSPSELTGKVNFHSFLQAPTEFFRFVAKTNNQSFTVTASLFNHETVLRSTLLKKVGFNIPKVFAQKESIINFDSTASMDLFLEKLVESTLLAKKRWVIEENRTENYLKMRGLVLEPADSKSVPVYWPIMEETRQRKRRVFRSLLYVYALTDFNMPINEISWTLGKKFNKELILSHHYSDDFMSVTIADLRWLHRRMILLPEKDLCSGLTDAHYPADIAELLCEKLKSRINSLGELIGLKSSLKVNEKIDNDQVSSGKLVSGDYPDYVPVFWVEDVESPYRFSEVFKFFRTQVTYDTISNILTTAQKRYMPDITSGDASDKIIMKIKEFGNQNGYIPLKVWSMPTIGGSVGGSRNIVFGKYDGNDAPIQLVDTLQMSLQIGLFSYMTIPGSPVSPTGVLNAQLVRNWNHVKAMPDLTTATRQKVESLLVPKLYHSLGTLLKTEPVCSLQNEAWVGEGIIAGVGIWFVYYDANSPSGKESALKLREELIKNGTPANKVLLQATQKDELCLKEITEKRNKNIDEFLKSFAMDETLTVTDSLETSAGLGVKLSDPYINTAKVQLGIERNRAILRSYILRKTENGIEITIRNQKNLSNRFNQELKFFISLLSNSTNWLNGELHSKVYRVNFEEADDEQKKIAVQVLREVLLRNSYGLLTEHYNPIVMDHDAKVRLNTFKFLWRKNENLKMNHEMTVTLPNRETQREAPIETIVDEWTVPVQTPSELSEKERSRNLFSTMVLKRRGSNYHAFLNQIVNDQFSWLSTGAQQTDPGQSIMGKSFHEYVVTEGDLSPGFEFNPVTKVEFGHLGWSASPEKLEKYLRTHEKYLSTPEDELRLDRSIFNQTTKVRSYNIRTTLILYPMATQKLMHSLLEKTESESINLLKDLYGSDDWSRYCNGASVADVKEEFYFYESTEKENLFYCVPHQLIDILDMRKQGIAKRRQDLGIQINKIVQILISNVHHGKLLSWIGQENYFGNTFISGFRNNDSLGYTQYASDTVGAYNKDLETGIFDQVARLLGVKAYNLKGMVYTPNM